MSQLRIAVDGRVVQDRYHGIGRSTRDVLASIARHDDVVLLILCCAAPATRVSPQDLEGLPGVTLVPFEHDLLSARSHLAMPRVMRNIGADVLLVPYHLFAPLYTPCPMVSIVHDCIFEVDDINYPNRLTQLTYRPLTRLALRRSAAVVTPSEASADAVWRYYGRRVPTEAVVRWGVSQSFFEPSDDDARAAARARLGVEGPYLLHVGVRRPHKNQATLVRSLAILRDHGHEMSLVLVGSPDGRFVDPVPSLVRELGLEGRVRQVSGIPDELLLPTYHGAAAFLLPSLVEGFGLPLLEAMAAQVPIVASDLGVCREVGADAMLLADPADANAWADAIQAILTDDALTANLRGSGREHATKATWERAGDQLLAILDAAARV